MRKKNKIDIYSRKISYEFFRWGSLGIQNHLEARYSDDDPRRTFHTAPVKRGIYAFPKGYIEPFLLGKSPDAMVPGKEKNQRFFWLRDDNGNKITALDYYTFDEVKHIDGRVTKDINWGDVRPEILQMLKRRKIKQEDVELCSFEDNKFAVYSCKPTKFTYSGPFIWHHLKEYCKDEHPEGKWSDRCLDSEYRLLVKLEDILDSKGSWIKTTMKVWLSALKKVDTINRWKCYYQESSKNSRSGNPHTFPDRSDKDEFEVFIEKI